MLELLEECSQDAIIVAAYSSSTEITRFSPEAISLRGASGRTECTCAVGRFSVGVAD